MEQCDEDRVWLEGGTVEHEAGQRNFAQTAC